MNLTELHTESEPLLLDAGGIVLLCVFDTGNYKFSYKISR